MKMFAHVRAATAAALTVVLPLALVAGCDDSSSDSSANQNVTLQFAAVAGDTSIGCDAAATNMGAAASQTLTIKDFRLYISAINLINEDGDRVPVVLNETAWQMQHGEHSVALLDFTSKGDSCTGAAKAMNTAITGKVPRGVYTGVEFDLGVPAGHNHESVATAEAPLDNIAMSWSWQSGRKFAKLESKYEVIDPVTSAVTTTSQTFHLGSTGCTGGDAAHPDSVTCTGEYRPTVTLDDFDVRTGVIVADYRELFAETDLSASITCMPGTSALCQGLAAKVGADSTGASTGTQSFFRVEYA